MKDLQHYTRSLEALLERDERYPISAYGFVLSALQDTISHLDRPRHISGQELAEGFRQFALEQFGPMALTVLGAWNVHSTDDVGAIVFNLVEIGLLNKTPDDRPEDFHELYAFREVFGGPYRYLQNERR